MREQEGGGGGGGGGGDDRQTDRESARERDKQTGTEGREGEKGVGKREDGKGGRGKKNGHTSNERDRDPICHSLSSADMICTTEELGPAPMLLTAWTLTSYCV